MTARSVLLAMAAASFLRGDEPLNTGSDGRAGAAGARGFSGEGTSLSQRWRECDQQAQLSLASANPQVEKHETRAFLQAPLAHAIYVALKLRGCRVIIKTSTATVEPNQSLDVVSSRTSTFTHRNPNTRHVKLSQ